MFLGLVAGWVPEDERKVGWRFCVGHGMRVLRFKTAMTGRERNDGVGGC